MQTIKEIKNHKNKATQRFSCELLLREACHVVLQYRAEEAGRVGDIAIAPGSTTIAHYWQDKHYVLWRMFDNRGCLIGTLFHICTDVVITDTSVSYLDLLLDIWITPQG
ncbi:MAG: DUF402 domain-containing protein, partial [Deltaproteobacteria bacterium]|nr:DUF402 domain-containing protein [Deltaproteobacteria bacterium]